MIEPANWSALNMPEYPTRLSELENSLRDGLAKQGIDSLDGLVSRVASSRLNRLQNEDMGSFWRTRRDSIPPKPHKPPEVNLFVDGRQHESSKITEFNGRALYSTTAFNSKGEPVMHSFTSMEGLHDYLLLLSAARHEDLGTTNPDILSELANYFVDPDLRGDRLQNNPGRAWRDLTRVSRSAFGLGDWNDVISSVDWCRWDIILHEHINFEGSILYIRGGTQRNHLGLFGWDDRTSSTENRGFRI